MSTIIYGESDDLIELEGHVSGEIGCYHRPVVLRVGDANRGCYLVWRYPDGAPVAPDVSATWSVEIIAIDDGNDDGAPLPTVTVSNGGRSRGPCVTITEPLPIVRVVDGRDEVIR